MMLQPFNSVGCLEAVHVQRGRSQRSWRGENSGSNSCLVLRHVNFRRIMMQACSTTLGPRNNTFANRTPHSHIFQDTLPNHQKQQTDGCVNVNEIIRTGKMPLEFNGHLTFALSNLRIKLTSLTTYADLFTPHAAAKQLCAIPSTLLKIHTGDCSSHCGNLENLVRWTLIAATFFSSSLIDMNDEEKGYAEQNGDTRVLILASALYLERVNGKLLNRPLTISSTSASPTKNISDANLEFEEITWTQPMQTATM